MQNAQMDVRDASAPDTGGNTAAVGNEFLALSSSLTVVWAFILSPEFKAFCGTRFGVMSLMGSLILGLAVLAISYRDQGPIMRIIGLILVPLIAYLIVFISPFFILGAFACSFYRGRSLSNMWIYAALHAWAILVLEIYLGWTIYLRHTGDIRLAGPGSIATWLEIVAFVMMIFPVLAAFVQVFRVRREISFYRRETTGNLRLFLAIAMVLLPCAAMWTARLGFCSSGTAVGMSGILCGGLETISRGPIAKQTKAIETPHPGEEELPTDWRVGMGCLLFVLLILLTAMAIAKKNM